VPPVLSTNALPIEVRGLAKHFGDLAAVDGLDLTLPRKACLALLGPNGAGKTTTIEILEGLQRADAGEVRVLGRTWAEDARGIRERIGVQLQETNLPERLRVREVVALFASLYAEPQRVEAVLERVDLREKERAQVRELSGGQRQRLSLACALVGSPEVLFLDEPTTGLDPQARRGLWRIVEEFRAAGGSVLLSTHFMDEAEILADEVVILDRGRALVRGSPRAVIASLNADAILEFGMRRHGVEQPIDPADPLAAPLLAELAALEGVGRVERDPRDATRLRLSAQRVERLLSRITERFAAHSLELDDLRLRRPTLEDVFLALTGKRLEEA
jgi:ABC-2 type transport system ATP-binding protein